MTHFGFGSALERAALLAALALATSCHREHGDASLSKADEDDANLPNFPPPAENGPKLGVIANLAPVFERPTKNARTIGALHAGAIVTRGATPVRKTKDCDGGYYAIYPRGFACVNQGLTLALEHPTLAAMAIQPTLDQALPYTYGRTRVDTALYERDPGKERAVREVQKLRRGSALAVVGSWTASIGDGEPERLALSTNGRFVPAQDLEAVRGSSFVGYEFKDGKEPPVAFVLKRGVSAFKTDGDQFSKKEGLDFHETLPLTGRFRTVSGTKLWATSDNERWIRDQDVTIVHRRTRFPDFVHDGVRWLDVGVTLGTLTAYEGKKAIFATLVSAGRDRAVPDTALVGDAPPAVTKLGTFEVVAKDVTLLSAAPERAGERFSVFDLPWVLELSSGQMLLGAYWHDRFGIEHGGGDLTVSPEDAHRLFQWATPGLPAAWHAANSEGNDKTMVVIHK
jgi:hypothetical protein